MKNQKPNWPGQMRRQPAGSGLIPSLLDSERSERVKPQRVCCPGQAFQGEGEGGSRATLAC